MKVFFFIITLFISNIVFSQNRGFIRVYDNNKHKIAKGYLQKITDSSILLAQGNKRLLGEIHYSKIGNIKLRRSTGHAIAMVALANAAVYGILGAATAQNSSDANLFFSKYNTFEGLGMFGILGAVQGAIVGTVVGGTKSIIVKKITPINGDYTNWIIAKQQLSKWLIKS
ncbi:MAG: hypothetical protein H7101_01555 [Deinococcales bacterium]|nr:hypothetical protein [Chitinophagaceae bacterium]